MRHLFLDEIGIASAKAGQNRVFNAQPNLLVAIGELQCDLDQHQT